MKKLTLALSWIAFLWLISPARAQVGQETLIPGTPPGGIGGACLISSFGYLVPVTQGSEIVLCDPTSHLWTVTSGGGSGSCGALTGDVTGTCAANVVSTISTAGIALPGNPTTTTQSAGNNSTRIATTAFVATAAGAYLPLAGGTMTGNLLFTDGLYDIGATAATRPRNIFLSNALTSASATLTGLSGATTRCVTVSTTGALGAATDPCGTSNGSVQGTIAGTSVAITHASTSILNFNCFTSGGVWLQPNTVTQTSATVLTIAFLSDQTGGTCNVFTQGSVTSSGVSSVSGTAPIVSSGGTTPAISISRFRLGRRGGRGSGPGTGGSASADGTVCMVMEYGSPSYVHTAAVTTTMSGCQIGLLINDSGTFSDYVGGTLALSNGILAPTSSQGISMDSGVFNMANSTTLTIDRYTTGISATALSIVTQGGTHSITNVGTATATALGSQILLF